MNKDYTQLKGFWLRLKNFVREVQVSYAGSEVEQDMILNICKQKLNSDQKDIKS